MLQKAYDLLLDPQARAALDGLLRWERSAKPSIGMLLRPCGN